MGQSPCVGNDTKNPFIIIKSDVKKAKAELHHDIEAEAKQHSLATTSVSD